MAAHVGILYAPGTNCHQETRDAVTRVLGVKSTLVILSEEGKLSHRLKNFSHLIFPGGFSFGDHFGAGRVAALLLKQGCIDELRKFIHRGGKIMGVCNGFQILCELGLLPGALVKNKSGLFESRWVTVRTTLEDFWENAGTENRVLHLPVAHAEGRLISRAGDIAYPAMHYLNKESLWAVPRDYPENPNGSERAIAGLLNGFSGQIFGLMPHPERAYLSQHKSQDGLVVLKTFLYQNG